MPSKSYYITTPIYYVNDKPHIGHAYTTLACDLLARFKRLDGYDVMFLTGTDEHGQKVEKAAQTAGIDPKAFCDQVSQNFRDLAKSLNVSNTDFIRTTEPRHIKSVQALWDKLLAAGDIYLGHYEGWYAVRDEAFYQEDELTAGPDGSKLAPSGAPVEWVKEPSYFFKLSAWGERLLKFYDENPGFILPNSRRNEVISFVKGGLHDLSVSRTTFKWGVPVPNDPAHIMYVWLDALTNYMTAAGYPDTDSASYKRYWPADLHMVGKDILRFHAVYWPAFLMAAGLQPPKRVFAHGWWTNEGQKISKSLGNVIDPLALIEEFGLDQTRYFLMREVPFGNDGDFRRDGLIQRINSELANGFGNLAQRTLSFCAKNADASVPAPGPLADIDEALLAQADSLSDTMRKAMDEQALHVALQSWYDLVDAANKYIDVAAPWTLRKTDPARMNTVLWALLETIRQLAILAQPAMPDSAARMLDQLGVSEAARSFAHLGEAGRLRAGTPLPTPQGVFPRYQDAAKA
ncbi:methionine--tRNA ligase [Ferrovibrio sp.]|uniref:methionine--tRNA ligase n=1 Tax=Ferrovibrio sp. TaxID=1917215 RepID=UPI0025BF593D|nr:methionine--tRNA ligase [Ferrovibrio sp.]MBX3456594.1 methionine--tRNA ligase [Ferrovibrio sp.]